MSSKVQSSFSDAALAARGWGTPATMAVLTAAKLAFKKALLS
jgi:hypothetical protein